MGGIQELDSDRYKANEDGEDIGSMERIYATFNKEKTTQRISNEDEANMHNQQSNPDKKVGKRKMSHRKGSSDLNDIKYKL